MPQIYLEHFVSAMRRINVSPPPPPKTFRPTCVHFLSDDEALIQLPCKEGWLALQVNESDLHAALKPPSALTISVTSAEPPATSESKVRIRVDDSPMSSA